MVRVWRTALFHNCLLLLLITKKINSWVIPCNPASSTICNHFREVTKNSRELSLFVSRKSCNNQIIEDDGTVISYRVQDTPNRRSFVLSSIVLTAGSLLVSSPDVATAVVQRAVGSGEIKCREAGNCLETGELDGALGWGWGGKDRCDATDPLCGTDGKLRETAITGKPVPSLPSDSTIFSHVAVLQVSVGREELGTLKIGLYGNECPGSVSELVDFLSNDGLRTLDSNVQANNMGSFSKPVTLTRGGVVNAIVPGLSIEFGVPSQSYAYARQLGMSKAGDGYVPQPKPIPSRTSNDSFIRQHDCAGLVSLPSKGIGYGGSGYESDDETFESAFLITADSVPQLDKNKNRRVIGQIIDAASMAFLERLANLPTKRGIRGVIPGQTFGPPLLKTVVREVQVAKVTQPSSVS